MGTVSSCVSRLRGSLALVLAMLGWAPSVALAADGPIADPKLWCGKAAEMIADKNTEGFIDSFVFASGRLIDRPTVEQVFAALAPALAREGEALGHDFLLQGLWRRIVSGMVPGAIRERSDFPALRGSQARRWMARLFRQLR